MHHPHSSPFHIPSLKIIIAAFGTYIRQKFHGQEANQLIVLDEHENTLNDRKLRVSFAVRDVGSLTGRRVVSNLNDVRSHLYDKYLEFAVQSKY